MATNITNTTVLKMPANFRCFRPQYSIEFQYQFFKGTHAILAPLNTVCVFFSIFANTLILLAVRKHIRLHTPSSLLLCSLNIKDIVFVSSAQLLQICESLIFLVKDNLCHTSLLAAVLLFLVFCGRSTGLFSMIMISIDRWFAIHKPHIYRRVLTKKRVYCSVAVFWIIGIAVSSSAPFLSIPDLSTLMMALFGSTTIVVTILQLSIYYGVKRQRLRTFDMTSSQLTQISLERSVATVVFYIIIGLVVCYLPFLFSVAVILFNGKNYVYFAKHWLQFAIYVNAMVNPIIMIKTNRKLRRAVLDVLSKSFPCFVRFKLTDDSMGENSGNAKQKSTTNASLPDSSQQAEKLSSDMIKIVEIKA